MLLKFNLSDQPLELEEISYVGLGFVIGKHPELGTDCIFLKDSGLINTPAVEIALHRLDLQLLNLLPNQFQGIWFYEVGDNGKTSDNQSRAKSTVSGDPGKGCGDSLQRPLERVTPEEDDIQSSERTQVT